MITAENLDLPRPPPHCIRMMLTQARPASLLHLNTTIRDEIVSFCGVFKTVDLVFIHDSTYTGNHTRFHPISVYLDVFKLKPEILTTSFRELRSLSLTIYVQSKGDTKPRCLRQLDTNWV